MKSPFRFITGAVSVVIFVVLLTFGALWLVDGPMTNTKLRSIYGHIAVNTLAISASTAFDSTDYVCMKTTKQYERTGPNSFRLSAQAWPSGKEPNCADFFSSAERSFDAEIAIPRTCDPAYTEQNVGGPRGSYVVVAADGTDLQPLRDASLSAEARAYFRESGDGLSKFIRAGGLEGVDITLIENQTCDGFSLFRFQTEVKDISKMRDTMQEEGGAYPVGLK